MSPQARMAAGNAPVPEAGVDTSSDAGAGPFVINLTSSTTPMALAHPDSPELKRFSFFVSRRREDNRERFRLHMGYFSTLAEAEEWLNIIRDLYPGAWAGEAPGKKLRARAAAAELAKQLPAPPPAPSHSAPPAVTATRQPTTKPMPSRLAAAAAGVASATHSGHGTPGHGAAAATVSASIGAMPAGSVAIEVPTLQAAPALPAAPQVGVNSAAPMLEAVAQAAAALAAVAKMAQSSPGAFGAADQTVMAPNPFAAAPINQAALSQPSFTPAPPAPVVAAPAPQPPRAPARPASAPTPAASAAGSAANAAAAAAAKSAAGSKPAAAAAQAGAAAARTQPAAPKAPAAQPPMPAAAAPARPAAKGARKNPANALTDGSNVREVMASLDETGETRQMQIPPGLRAPAPAGSKPAAPAVASAAQAARPAGAAAGRAPTAPAQNATPGTQPNLASPGAQNVARSGTRSPAAPAAAQSRTVAPPPARVPAADSSDSMSDTQVLRMLETRRSDEAEKGSDDANSGISLLKPDDTQTRRALKEAVIDNAPVSFAVQLQWSVQPVDLNKVPPLAIFSAYTLYTVEGSREGRKWYGLRLGFFSDAISAKQVAYYVRSEFASVAVVPVSPAEKGRASDEETKAATGAFQRKRVEQKIEEFKLFDDDKSVLNEPAPKAAEAPKPAAAPAAKAGVPVRKNKPLGRVRAKEQRSPKTLEETLEILGASDLEIDNGRGEVLNDTGVRHLRVEVQKNTPFAKLLDRISERVRKN